jgi:hypothetical protein
MNRFNKVFDNIPEREGKKRVPLREDPTKRSVTLFLDKKRYADARHKVELLQMEAAGEGDKLHFSDVVDGLIDKWLKGEVEL